MHEWELVWLKLLLLPAACLPVPSRYWEDTELMGKISAKLRDMKLAGGQGQQQQAAKPSKVERGWG
jgi:hypothetical protein